MNFRTKIRMLPISAAAVFVIGVAISFIVGERTSSVLAHLHEVDNPHMSYVTAVDRSTEPRRAHRTRRRVSAPAEGGGAEDRRSIVPNAPSEPGTSAPVAGLQRAITFQSCTPSLAFRCSRRGAGV